VRSPSIANKLKSQFQWRSIKALDVSAEYDGDAVAMTSQEVVGCVGSISSAIAGHDGAGHDQSGEDEDLAQRTPGVLSPVSDQTQPVLQELQWLKSGLHR
jgi:hypothetical protein